MVFLNDKKEIARLKPRKAVESSFPAVLLMPGPVSPRSELPACGQAPSLSRDRLPYTCPESRAVPSCSLCHDQVAVGPSPSDLHRQPRTQLCVRGSSWACDLPLPRGPQPPSPPVRPGVGQCPAQRRQGHSRIAEDGGSERVPGSPHTWAHSLVAPGTGVRFGTNRVIS